MSHKHQAPDALRVNLAHALGFHSYPTSAKADPYLNYITNRYIGRGTLESYLKLVIHVAEHFQTDDDEKSLPGKSIQGLVESLTASSNEHFSDTKIGSQTRREDVEDTVLYIIGVWSLMLSSFVHLPFAGGARKIALAYGIRAQETPSTSKRQPYEETVSGLIKGSGLLPTPSQWSVAGREHNGADLTAAVHLMAMLRGSPAATTPHPPGSATSVYSLDAPSRISLRFLDALDSLESQHVAATRLNAHTLRVFGAVDIAWTHNISRHMLLCPRGGRHVLELFALPSALGAASLTSDAVGIAPEYAQEISESYSVLFNARRRPRRHASVVGWQRVCWCWSCSSMRYRDYVLAGYRAHAEQRTSRGHYSAQASEFDPLLIALMANEPSDWTPEIFPCLWSRIVLLEEHLRAAKPWNIWILFRDHRDTLQFWTFFFATVVVVLTFVQVVLGVAQVVGSFHT